MRPATVLVVAALLFASTALAQTDTPATPRQKHTLAVTVLRAINNAELRHRMTSGRYAALNEFAPGELDLSRLHAANPTFPNVDFNAGADAVPGFDLRIIVSADGNAYTVKLKDKDRGTCGTDAFTDEVGLIYFAGPIDCNFDSLQPFASAAAPAAADQTVRVSQGVMLASLIHKVDPEYPATARQARLQGSVVLQVRVGADGNVTNVRVLSGHPMLVQSAIDAVRQWQFKPYYLNGQPVVVETQVAVPFTLQ